MFKTPLLVSEGGQYGQDLPREVVVQELSLQVRPVGLLGHGQALDGQFFYMNPQASDEQLKVLVNLTTLEEIRMSNNKMVTSLSFLKNAQPLPLP